MWKLLRNKKGQKTFTEYSITFFLVVAFLAAMGVYIRRTLQARVIAVERYVIGEVNSVFANNEYYNYLGNYAQQYDPYYAVSRGVRTVDSEIVERLLPVGAGKTEIYEKIYVQDVTNMDYVSNQLSPQYAD